MSASSPLPSIHPPRLGAPFHCDCCSNPILPEYNDHIQNTPCEHNICIPCLVKSNMKRAAHPDFCQVRDCCRQFITSCQYFNRGMAGEFTENESAVELGIDEVASILSFLPPTVIMCLRRVDKIWRDAAKITVVPSTDFLVDDVKKYRVMRVLARVLPNLQQITLRTFGHNRQIWNGPHKWSDGEDPDEELAARTVTLTVRGIKIISNFSKLKILEICESGLDPSWNGRYPVFFNSFPLLQTLCIHNCKYLKWDLEMLAGMPLLKQLDSINNDRLTGNIRSLRVLKNTLEKITLMDCPNVEGNVTDLADFPRLKELNLGGTAAIRNDHLTGNINTLIVLKHTLERVKIRLCNNVEGNFMDLADFPHLKELNLRRTAVTGEIRDIGENDFASLEQLNLPKGVYGGAGYELQRISDTPDLVRAVYLLKKQRPTLKIEDWYGVLSSDSPDWYESVEEDEDEETPPFYIYFVEAGPRIGYRWETFDGRYCEVNWLDPEPESDSSDYEDYVSDYQRIQREIG